MRDVLRLRRLAPCALVVVTAAVLAGFGAGFASAAAMPNNPVITFTRPSPDDGQTLITNSPTFAFTYNRTPKQTKSLTCALSGPTSSSGPCDSPVAGGAGSTSGKSYTGLATGSYTFTVSMTLGDGGTATATTHFAYRTGIFEEASPVFHAYAIGSDWFPADSTGSWSSPLKPAGGMILPPTPTPSSTSGCTPADFNGSFVGRIALIQRGGCNFGVKVLNAEAVGASGVVIFNEGNNSTRMDAIPISLRDAAGNLFTASIPVVFTSFAIGQDLYNQSLSQATILGLDVF
jgi:PA domain